MWHLSNQSSDKIQESVYNSCLMQKKILTFILLFFVGVFCEQACLGQNESHEASASPEEPLNAEKALEKKGNSTKEKQIWNLQDAEILKVVAEVSRQTGKNFLVDPQLNGKVTIVSSKPLDAEEVYPVFLSALQLLGYGTVENGKLIKIVPIKDAAQSNSRFEGQDTKSKPGDNLLVKVIHLRYVSAIQLTPNLAPLVPAWASVSAYAPSNSVIISGTGSVVKRISEIVSSVDTPMASGVDIIHLKYADAAEVVKSLDKLQQANRNISGDFSSAISADTRSNSILLSGSEFTRIHYKVLISQLDISTQNNPITDTQVIKLEFKQVSSIIPVLKAAVRQSVDSSLAQASNMSANTTTGSSGSSGSAPQVNKIPEISNAALNAGSASANDQTGVTIVGDVPGNILIITAPPNIMRTLKEIIAKLDIRPRQVLVQGIVAQVDANHINNFGIQWGTGAPITATGFMGAAGLGMGFIQKGSITAVIAALTSDQNSNILSTPSITVLNNGSASISIGETVSVTTGTTTQSTAGGNPLSTNTYDYKNVGLALSVVPQITSDGSVQLRIVQTNSSILGASSSSNPNPNFSNQSLETSVLVKSEDIVVLGGLTSSQEEIGTQKLPILGSIPLIGRLFQRQEKKIVKKDLLVFLRPVIIDDQYESKVLSETKYSYIHDMELNNLNVNQSHRKGSSVLPLGHGRALPVPF